MKQTSRTLWDQTKSLLYSDSRGSEVTMQAGMLNETGLTCYHWAPIGDLCRCFLRYRRANHWVLCWLENSLICEVTT